MCSVYDIRADRHAWTSRFVSHFSDLWMEHHLPLIVHLSSLSFYKGTDLKQLPPHKPSLTIASHNNITI